MAKAPLNVTGFSWRVAKREIRKFEQGVLLRTSWETCLPLPHPKRLLRYKTAYFNG